VTVKLKVAEDIEVAVKLEVAGDIKGDCEI
jgi:hypothetical protein